MSDSVLDHQQDKCFVSGQRHVVDNLSRHCLSRKDACIYFIDALLFGRFSS